MFQESFWKMDKILDTGGPKSKQTGELVSQSSTKKSTEVLSRSISSSQFTSATDYIKITKVH